MGDFFDNQESEEKVEEEEKLIDSDDKVSKEDINVRKIIGLRNKVYAEIKEIKNDLRERIGRLNLHLFGDPDNEDFESTLQELQEETRHPMTRRHPIAAKTQALINDVKQFQQEYNKLQKFDDKYVKQMGELIDYTIGLYTELVEKYNEIINKGAEQGVELEKEETPRNFSADRPVSAEEQEHRNEILEIFYENKEFLLQKQIDNLKSGNLRAMAGYKAKFFGDIHKKGLEFDINWLRRIYYKEIEKPAKEWVEQIQPQPDPLRKNSKPETEKTLNTYEEKKNVLNVSATDPNKNPLTKKYLDPEITDEELKKASLDNKEE